MSLCGADGERTAQYEMRLMDVDDEQLGIPVSRYLLHASSAVGLPIRLHATHSKTAHMAVVMWQSVH